MHETNDSPNLIISAEGLQPSGSQRFPALSHRTLRISLFVAAIKFVKIADQQIPRLRYLSIRMSWLCFGKLKSVVDIHP
jgi:hypothetical protein